MKKNILFYNISGAIYSNKISEIFILFEYFQNMHPCHRRLKKDVIYKKNFICKEKSGAVKKLRKLKSIISFILEIWY